MTDTEQQNESTTSVTPGIPSNVIGRLQRQMEALQRGEEPPPRENPPAVRADVPAEPAGEAEGAEQQEEHVADPAETEPEWFKKRTQAIARDKNEALARAKEAEARAARAEKELLELRKRTKGQDAREAVTERVRKTIKDDETLLTPETVVEASAAAAEEYTKGFDEDRETLRRMAAKERLAEQLDEPLTPKQMAFVTDIHLQSGGSLDAEESLLLARKRKPDLFANGASEPPAKNPSVHYTQRQNGTSPGRAPRQRTPAEQAREDMHDPRLSPEQRAEAARQTIRDKFEPFVQRVHEAALRETRRR